MTKQTERLEQEYIDESIERDRIGGHPLGHRAVREVLEITQTAQEGYDAKTR